MNAHDTISEAVSKVLAGHESRNPWQNCCCGWRGPTITLSSIVRKRLFQKHVADAVADALADALMRKPWLQACGANPETSDSVCIASRIPK